MANWFECTVAYDKTGDDGLLKTVAETYLVDAISFTEAEERITEEMRPYMMGEFEVRRVKKVKIAELFDNVNGDRWFKSKVNFVVLDEVKGIEKRQPNTMYIKANNIQEALVNLIKGMAGTLADYEIANIAETQIWDVFYYTPPAAEAETETEKE